VKWEGAPYQFAIARLDGSMQARVERGKFLEVGNSAASRVWGLLNFEKWFNRLQLEFDDLRSSEMIYDQIVGRYAMRANTVNVKEMTIDSPSIKMRMHGELDLSSRTLDMAWYVTIPVTRNLMLPAAVVGGVPLAATAFVIDRVLGKQIDRLTTLTYDVSGSFDEPVTSVRSPL
jgi:uncharacterized protein YhdP